MQDPEQVHGQALKLRNRSSRMSSVPGRKSRARETRLPSSSRFPETLAFVHFQLPHYEGANPGWRVRDAIAPSYLNNSETLRPVLQQRDGDTSNRGFERGVALFSLWPSLNPTSRGISR